MRLYEVVNRLLGVRLDRGELQAHADATIGPGDSSFGVDVLLPARQTESHPDDRRNVEGIGRADGEATLADVQRQRCRDGVADAIRDRHPEDHARARTPVVMFGEEM